MSLFVVHHKHDAESCPARDAKMGSMLLQHLSEENAEKFNVKIQGEAVANGAHSLYLIVEANTREHVDMFMTPFAQAGDVEILAASSCSAVVQRGMC